MDDQETDDREGGVPDMPTTGSETAERTSQAVGTTLKALDVVLADEVDPDFAVVLWDGTRWGADPEAPPRFTLTLSRPGSLRRMLSARTGLALGEAFIFGDFDIEGDVEATFATVDRLFAGGASVDRIVRAAPHLARLPRDEGDDEDRGWRAARPKGRTHSKRRDRQTVRYHYDVGNDFFALWLDREMVYSCGYFGCQDNDIHRAQERKIDYVCRKLRLGPGMRLLDLGCGWGGLVRHAAREYGAEAVGITLSEPQAEHANAVIREEGLSNRARVEVLDYRDAERLGAFDRIASVGMFEHVGEEKLPGYFERAFDLLEPGGVFMNHGIARAHGHTVLSDPDGFTRRYVFPDGDLVPIGSTVRAAEAAGFEVRDVESLREHYMMTLRHWVRRLEERREEAIALTDEVTYRIWRLYMSASAHGFRSGRLNVYQTLLAKPSGAESGLPLTREDWYAERDAV